MISLQELVFGEIGSGDYANRIGGAWGYGSSAQLAQPEEWDGLKDREAGPGGMMEYPDQEEVLEAIVANNIDQHIPREKDYPAMRQDVLVKPEQHVPSEYYPGKKPKIDWNDLVVTIEDPRPSGVNRASSKYLVTTNGVGIRGFRG